MKERVMRLFGRGLMVGGLFLATDCTIDGVNTINNAQAKAHEAYPPHQDEEMRRIGFEEFGKYSQALMNAADRPRFLRENIDWGKNIANWSDPAYARESLARDLWKLGVTDIILGVGYGGMGILLGLSLRYPRRFD